jgi:S1-C subfamily serine protease
MRIFMDIKCVYSIWGLVFSAVAWGQDLPLQTEEQRAVLRHQSNVVFDLVSPISQKSSKSCVWVWAGGSRQLCVGTVVGDGSQVLAKWSEVARAREGKLLCVGEGNETFPATIEGVYEEEDLVLLKLKDSTLKPVTFSSKQALELGQFLVAAAPGDTTLGFGVVSVAERSLRESDQAFVGIGAETHQDGTGVIVREVADDSPAKKADISKGDIILSVNGQIISGLMQFRSLLSTLKPGENAVFRYSRKGDHRDVELKLAAKPKNAAFPQRRLEVMERMGGDISNVRDGFPAVIQTDLVLNPEECGGPVLDLKGNVVGIMAARAGRIRSYVISASAIEEMLKGKPVEESLARVKKQEPGPKLAGSREARPRLNRQQMQRLRARMKEMDSLMRELDQEINQIDR